VHHGATTCVAVHVHVRVPVMWFYSIIYSTKVRTTHGACTSLVVLATMAYLFMSELSFYSKIEVVDRLSVNSTHGEHVSVKFDVTFPHIPCDLLSLDALDSSGQKQVPLACAPSFRVIRCLVHAGNGAMFPARTRVCPGLLAHQLVVKKGSVAVWRCSQPHAHHMYLF